MSKKQKVNWRKVYNHSYHRNIEIFEPGEVDHARIMIRRIYPEALQRRREIVDLELFGVYENLKIPDKFISEALYKLNLIKSENGKSLREIAGEIRAYLSYRCSFHKENGDPVKFDTIILAYQGVCCRKPKDEVKSIIYK